MGNHVNEITNILEDYKSNEAKLLKISYLLLKETIKSKENAIEISRNIACVFYKLPLKNFEENKSRHGLLSRTKQLFSFLTFLYFNIGPEEIAKSIGRDRTTVYASCQRFIQDYETDKQFSKKVNELLSEKITLECINEFKNKRHNI